MRIDSLMPPPAKRDEATTGTSELRAHSTTASTPAPENDSKRAAAEPAKTVAAAARQIEAYLKSNGRSLEFRVDAQTHRTIVTVRDKASGEVIRQIPGDEVLQLARRLAQGSGALLDLQV
jgi:flagellar protein FlaG